MSKVILITGGSSGIGKAVGEYLQKKDVSFMVLVEIQNKYRVLSLN